jgi:hypothetical protein
MARGSRGELQGVKKSAGSQNATAQSADAKIEDAVDAAKSEGDYSQIPGPVDDKKKPDVAKPLNKADLHKKSDDGAKRGKADNKPAEKGAKSKPNDAEISAERGAKSKPDDAEKSVEQKPPDATSLITEMHDQLPCAKVV